MIDKEKKEKEEKSKIQSAPFLCLKFYVTEIKDTKEAKPKDQQVFLCNPEIHLKEQFVKKKIAKNILEEPKIYLNICHSPK